MSCPNKDRVSVITVQRMQKKFNKETIKIIRVENPSFNFKKKMALVLDYAVFTEYVSFNFFSVYYIAHKTNLN